MQKKFTVFIKGMVCQRCISVVKDLVEKIGFQPVDVNLGEIIFPATTPAPDASVIAEKLKSSGFTVLEDKNEKLVKDIKQLVEEVYNGDYNFPARFRFSKLAKDRSGKNYDTISSVFSAIEKTTIEKYIINFRIRKIKELILSGNWSLSDISFSLGFSSVAHLSRQFKEVTGVNPSNYQASLSNNISVNTPV